MELLSHAGGFYLTGLSYQS